jgi:hypothetical protein
MAHVSSSEPVRVRYEPAGRADRQPGRMGDEPGAIETTLGETEAITVPAGGLWSIRASAEGFWSPEVFVTAGETVGPVVLPLYPTGEVRIPVELGALDDAPTAIEARFEPAPPRGASGDGARGRVECPVEQKVARCQVPEGTMDLRLSAPPWSPAYRFDVVVEPQEVSSLEPMELTRGASISGWLAREDGDAIPNDAAVELDLAGLAENTAPPGSRLGLVRQRVEVGERGFFQFLGVRPGFYDLTARAEGFAPGRLARVEARPDLESPLTDPLVLARPVELRLTLDPPTDPWGDPWSVRWSHEAADGERVYSFDEAEVPADGVLIRRDMAPGTYRIDVDGSEESRWLVQRIDLQAGSSDHFLSIPLVEIEGSVTRGREPVSGTLWFGGRHGYRSISIDVDDDGRFDGYLPEAGRWPVEWVAFDSEDTVALRPVEVPDESRARIDLEIPDTELLGEVVDDRGRPVVAASVRAVGVQDEDGPSIQAKAQTDEEGRFRIAGLEAGTYAVAARSGGAESAMTELTLSEDLNPPELRLILRDEFRIAGRVSSGGSPVAGARIVTWPELAGNAGVSLQQAYTGPTGYFEVDVAGEPGVFHFVVVAPGYAVHMGAAQASTQDFVDLVLDAHPGTLILELAALQGGSVLSHGGSFLPVQGLLRLAFPGQPPRTAGDSVVIPGVEPGEYALCDTRAMLAAGGASDESCRSGVLAPYGELRLSPPPAAGAPSR